MDETGASVANVRVPAYKYDEKNLSHPCLERSTRRERQEASSQALDQRIAKVRLQQKKHNRCLCR